MKTLTFSSSILKGAMLLMLMAAGGMLKAQSITINNNTSVAMKVWIVGEDGCGVCHAQNAVIVTGSVTITPTGNGCTIGHIVGAQVKPSCDSGIGVVVDDDGCASCGPSSYPSTDTFTIPWGGSCGFAIDRDFTVNADCSGTDLTITIDEL